MFVHIHTYMQCICYIPHSFKKPKASFIMLIIHDKLHLLGSLQDNSWSDHEPWVAKLMSKEMNIVSTSMGWCCSHVKNVAYHFVLMCLWFCSISLSSLKVFLFLLLFLFCFCMCIDLDLVEYFVLRIVKNTFF